MCTCRHGDACFNFTWTFVDNNILAFCSAWTHYCLCTMTLRFTYLASGVFLASDWFFILGDISCFWLVFILGDISCLWLVLILGDNSCLWLVLILRNISYLWLATHLFRRIAYCWYCLMLIGWTWRNLLSLAGSDHKRWNVWTYLIGRWVTEVTSGLLLGLWKCKTCGVDF